MCRHSVYLSTLLRSFFFISATMMSKMTYTFIEDLDSHTAPLLKSVFDQCTVSVYICLLLYCRYFLGLKGASPDVIVKMSGKGGSFYSQ